ncbi:MAG: metal ABC transporter permease [Rhodospirillales bacterium]|nr:metal ABC transporter permease [Rhodospirillales bacterium]
MADFLLRALLAGLGVAVVSGALGCFIVWRRMAYFGATLAHAALLGIALGLLFEVNVNLGILVVCVVVSALLAGLQQQGRLATDTLLGILAHGALALGLVVISFMETLRIDLLAYLFGDILAVTGGDLVWIYAGGAAVLAALVALWRPLLLITVHEELARVDGVATAPVRLAFMLLISVVIAVAMKIVGVLLIISLLIIPAAAARRLAGTPEQMALLASAIGCLAVLGGLGASLRWDTPAGPSIVVAATGLFFLLLAVPLRRAG